ncbi:hypothetical protein TNCV_593491 [Trichonephila clavipes]|nr:hypothetical protein TNCV_593491 [Trichonephila clavipes]
MTSHKTLGVPEAPNCATASKIETKVPLIGFGHSADYLVTSRISYSRRKKPKERCIPERDVHSSSLSTKSRQWKLSLQRTKSVNRQKYPKIDTATAAPLHARPHLRSVVTRGVHPFPPPMKWMRNRKVCLAVPSADPEETAAIPPARESKPSSERIEEALKWFLSLNAPSHHTGLCASSECDCVLSD